MPFPPHNVRDPDKSFLQAPGLIKHTFGNRNSTQWHCGGRKNKNKKLIWKSRDLGLSFPSDLGETTLYRASLGKVIFKF